MDGKHGATPKTRSIITRSLQTSDKDKTTRTSIRVKKTIELFSTEAETAEFIRTANDSEFKARFPGWKGKRENFSYAKFRDSYLVKMQKPDATTNITHLTCKHFHKPASVFFRYISYSLLLFDKFLFSIRHNSYHLLRFSNQMFKKNLTFLT